MLTDYADLQNKTIVFNISDYKNCNHLHESILKFFKNYSVVCSNFSSLDLESLVLNERYYILEKASEANDVFYSYAKHSNYIPMIENFNSIKGVNNILRKKNVVVKTFIRNGKTHYITKETLTQYKWIVDILLDKKNFEVQIYSPFKQANLYNLLECTVYSQQYIHLLHPFVRKYLEKLPDIYKEFYGLSEEAVEHLKYYTEELNYFYEYIETGDQTLFIKLQNSIIKKFVGNFAVKTKRFLAKTIKNKTIDLNCLNTDFLNEYKNYIPKYKLIVKNDEILLKTKTNIRDHNHRTNTLVHKRFIEKYINAIENNKHIPNYYMVLTKPKIVNKDTVKERNIKVLKETTFINMQENVVRLSNSSGQTLDHLKKIPILLINNYSYRFMSGRRIMHVLFYKTEDSNIAVTMVTAANHIRLTKLLTSKVPIK